MTDNNLWEQVDHYYEDLFVHEEDDLKDLRHRAEQAQIPPIAVSPALGKYLHLMVKISRARRVLEIGTLAGYSTIWMAKALPEDGVVVTLERDSVCLRVAQENFTRTGYDDRISMIEGSAVQSLEAMIENNTEPFDMIFIDADKKNNARYFELCLRLSRKGTVIIADNIIRQGEVVNPHTADENTRGVQTFNTEVAKETRISAVAMQTVGVKGYDGFGLIVVDA